MKVLKLMMAVLMLSACRTAPPIGPDGRPMAQLIAYNTSCRGSLRIILPDESKTTSYYVPSGPLRVLLEAESEPGYDSGFSGDPNYMCSDLSRHELTFIAEPGATYRLKDFEISENQYGIELRKVLYAGSPDTEAVKAQSQQISLKRKCGFFGLLPGCLP